MARRTLLTHALVALLSSAPCRGERRELEIVGESETGAAAAAASGGQEANTTALLAVQGQAASSSAARAAISSARSATNSSAVVAADASANGSSARQRDQPSEHSDSSTSQREESGDVLAGNLTAAAVQAHAALAHAVSALAQQQAHKRQVGKNETSEGDSTASAEGATTGKNETSEGDSTASAEGATTMPPEEQKLQEEEKTQLGSGISSLATAFSDPRAFLMGLDSIKTFAAGIRAAIEHGGEGKCLATGEFAGYGCADDKDMPKICSCRSVFERCWLPEDPSLIVKKFPSQAALDDAKALLFGKCYTSYLLIAAVGVGGLCALAVVANLLKGMFKKKPQD